LGLFALDLGIIRLGLFALDHSLSLWIIRFHFGSFALDLGIIRLGLFALDYSLSLWIIRFHFGSFALDLSLGTFRLGFFLLAASHVLLSLGRGLCPCLFLFIPRSSLE
jgi:hypothetical protein